MSDARRRVLLIYSRVGGGHLSAATVPVGLALSDLVIYMGSFFDY